jgi:hypothetical protein
MKTPAYYRAPLRSRSAMLDYLRTVADSRPAYGFSPSTLRFFRSRIGSGFQPSNGQIAVFVSSEQSPRFGGGLNPRAYATRIGSLTSGRVDTLGETCQYLTRAQAMGAAKRAAELLAYLLAGSGTCPTANGRDLELWELLTRWHLRERERAAEKLATVSA